MNFTFTWILDKFGFQPKVETFDFPVKPVAKKVAKKTVKKATTRKPKWADMGDLDKEVVKEAIKEWLNEKVTQFGWFSLRTIGYALFALIGYAWLSTHGFEIPKWF